MSETVRVDPDRLRSFGTEVYRRLGMAPAEAELVADTLVQADLWGHQSHGVLRMPWYAARLKSGVCDPRARPLTVVAAGAVEVIDGRDGMGQVIAAAAMDEAIDRARIHGVAVTALRNSGHFGTAMYFTLRAARQGCIAFLTTNTSPAMAPWGGRRKAVGNNPWSWAAPAGRRAPMVLDIANTAVARGKVYLARQRGEAIPATWALDADGVPTTDPAEAIAGMIQPMGQHKGYAISTMMDILSGVLSGSAFGLGVSGPYQAERRSGAGHFMIVLDIDAFQPLAQFEARVEQFIAELKATPTADGVGEILYPGEIEARNDRTNRRQGLSLPAETVADLRRLAREMGIDDLLSS